MDSEPTYTAFAGDRKIVTAALREMLSKTKREVDRGKHARILIFEDQTGRQVDFDFRGTEEDVLTRGVPSETRLGPGRPKLGVVSREVSLLPRHWDWLEQQPHGISAAIRRLVEQAIKDQPGKERARIARDAAGKFMWAIAGDLPNFEEASRALYAKDPRLLKTLIRDWPADIRKHIHKLVLLSVELEGGPVAASPGAE